MDKISSAVKLPREERTKGEEKKREEEKNNFSFMEIAH